MRPGKCILRIAKSGHAYTPRPYKGSISLIPIESLIALKRARPCLRCLKCKAARADFIQETGRISFLLEPLIRILDFASKPTPFLFLFSPSRSCFFLINKIRSCFSIRNIRRILINFTNEIIYIEKAGSVRDKNVKY